MSIRFFHFSLPCNHFSCLPLTPSKKFVTILSETEVIPLKVKKIALSALLCAIALTIFMVESQIPAPIPVPGVKLGLANIVTVFAVFALGPGYAVWILAGRVFLGALFSGNFGTIFYSAAGGFCAILVTICLQKLLTRKQIWVAGCLGAIAHSIGQMAAAVLLSGTVSILIYLPVLILCSVFAGSFTGLCAQLLVNRGKDLWKTILK